MNPPYCSCWVTTRNIDPCFNAVKETEAGRKEKGDASHPLNLCKDVKRPQNHKCHVKSMRYVVREKRNVSQGSVFVWIENMFMFCFMLHACWFYLNVIIREPAAPGGNYLGQVIRPGHHVT